MKGFKKDDLIKKVQTKLNNDPDLFYKQSFLNYAGYSIDSREPYTEIISDVLIKNYEQLKRIGENTPVRRTKSFNAHPNHIPNVNRRLKQFNQLEYCEKLLAIALYNSNKTYCLGKIRDYEVPLKENKSDKHGKIDIISLDDTGQSVKLIELKIKAKNGNDETLLRVLLEIYTYYKLIKNSYNKFLKDYELSPDNYKRFQPVILTDKKALSGETLSNIKKYPRIQALISMMNNELDSQVEGFVYDYPNRNEPFQEIKNKIMLQGDITITRLL